MVWSYTCWHFHCSSEACTTALSTPSPMLTCSYRVLVRIDLGVSCICQYMSPSYSLVSISLHWYWGVRPRSTAPVSSPSRIPTYTYQILSRINLRTYKPQQVPKPAKTVRQNKKIGTFSFFLWRNHRAPRPVDVEAVGNLARRRVDLESNRRPCGLRGGNVTIKPANSG